MDGVAHGVQVGVGLAVVARRPPADRYTVGRAVTFAVELNLVQVLPLLAVAFQPGGLAVVRAYATARCWSPKRAIW